MSLSFSFAFYFVPSPLCLSVFAFLSSTFACALVNLPRVAEGFLAHSDTHELGVSCIPLADDWSAKVHKRNL